MNPPAWAPNEETIAATVEPPYPNGAVPIKGSELVFQTIGEIATEVDGQEDPGWLARPVWPADAYGVIAAEQKLGKTWMVLDLMVSVASEGVWLEAFPVERSGPVVAFLGEGGKRKMLRRCRAIAESKGTKVEELAMHLCMRVPHLSKLPHLDEIAAKVAEINPVLVVVDPLYLAARGAKMSSLAEMGEQLEGIQHICQSFDAALVVVHHWNQTGSGTGVNRMSGAGSAEWGRVLVSASAIAKVTDPVTKETQVTVQAEFSGDEIPEETHLFRRRVWSLDPKSLASPMGYAVGAVQSGVVKDLRSRLLDLLTAEPFSYTKEEIAKRLGGRASEVRELISALDRESITARREDRKRSDGKPHAVWLWGPMPSEGGTEAGTEADEFF